MAENTCPDWCVLGSGHDGFCRTTHRKRTAEHPSYCRCWTCNRDRRGYKHCNHCDTYRPVKKDGTFRQHTAYAKHVWNSVQCPGSGRKPHAED